MYLHNLYAVLLMLSSAHAATTTFAIPSTTPTSAVGLDSAPVALSLEFFDFPSYFTNVSTTFQCMENLKELTNTSTPVRVGGTTQDRAVYDPNLDAYVSYTLSSGATAPSNLTYGPSFMTLAGTYDGLIVMGLNRGHDNLTNTIEAAKVAFSEIPTLQSIELGNEPDLYLGDGQQVATDTGVWTPATDAASEASWQIAVGEALGKTSFIQAGNFVSNPPTWGAAELINTESSSAFQYISDLSHHDYPQSGGADSTSVNLASLMSHESIVDNVAIYNADVTAANAEGFEYVMGETNSVSGGGAKSISSTFGAALWVLDYTLNAVAINIKRVYFHHGTVGYCYYCWFGNNTVFAPYYGAYIAASFLAGGTSIGVLDDGTSSYGGYVVFSEDATPSKVLLYNSDYYDGDSDRSSQTIILTGLTASSVSAKRLTASSATSTQSGGDISFGGQTFVDATCVIEGTEVVEKTTVTDGQASFQLSSSEALLLLI